MTIAEGLGAVLIITGWIIAVGKIYGTINARMEGLESRTLDLLERIREHHEDGERHWTQRERDDLNSRLEIMTQDLRSLIIRRR